MDLVALATHLKQFRQEIVEQVPLFVWTVLLPHLEPTAHFRQIFEYEPQGQTRRDIFPLAIILPIQGEPKRHTYDEDPVTDVANGLDPTDVQSLQIARVSLFVIGMVALLSCFTKIISMVLVSASVNLSLRMTSALTTNLF